MNPSNACFSARVRHWILGAGLVLVVLLTLLANLGLLPSWLSRAHAFPGGDKLGHFLIYGALMLAINAAQPADVRVPRLLSRGTLCLMFVVAGEELSQWWLPMRTASGWDLACSYAGILAARAWRRHGVDQPRTAAAQVSATITAPRTSSMRSRDTGFSSSAATPSAEASTRCRRSL